VGEIIGMHDLGVGIFVGAHQSIGYKVNIIETHPLLLRITWLKATYF
jgi:hypothetical protein